LLLILKTAIEGNREIGTTIAVKIRNFDRRAAAGDFATVVGVRRGSSWVRGYMALAVLQAYITS